MEKRGKNKKNYEILLSALLTVKTNFNQTDTPYTYILHGQWFLYSFVVWYTSKHGFMQSESFSVQCLQK